MCLVALALDAQRRFPLVVAANRDEFFDRTSERLAWFTPDGGGPAILAGRDLQGGGTWIGLTAEGRLALVTNVRKKNLAEPQAPSRGQIVTRWLKGDLSADRYWPHIALTDYAPFNLIAADFRQGASFWASSEAASPRLLERGIVGLSNGGLDEPWPKVKMLKQRLAKDIAKAESVDELASLLFSALSERSVAPDDALPATGVSREVERMLSAAFVRSPDLRYGTRCSTLIITERVGKRLFTHVLERTFTPGPGIALLRRSTIKDWPPKYVNDVSAAEPQPPVQAEAGEVSDTELAETPPPKKRRVRSLLRPSHKL